MYKSKNYTFTEYSPLKFVIRGKYSLLYKKELINFKGKWNTNLRGGEGILFFNSEKETVLTFLNQCEKNEIILKKYSLKNNHSKIKFFIILLQVYNFFIMYFILKNNCNNTFL